MPNMYPRVLTVFAIALLILAGSSGGCLSPSGPAASASPVTTVPAMTSPPAMTSSLATPVAIATTGTTATTQTTSLPMTSLPASPAVESGVVIQNFAFSPSSLTVSAGTTVTWTNMDSATHDTASLTGSPVAFASPPLSRGESFRFTFTEPGTYRYTCTFHPSMRGTIVVGS